MTMEENPEDRAERGAERRARPRFEVNDEATLLLMGEGRLLPGRVEELSLEGCRLRTREHFKAGAGVRVEVAFRVNGIAFRLVGVTQWTNEWNVVGIHFVDVPQRRIRDLAEVIGEVEAEAEVRIEVQAMEQLGAETQEEEVAAEEPAEEPAEEQAWIHVVAHEPASPNIERPDRQPSVPPRQPERRIESRLVADTSATICLIRSGSRLNGRILDLSLDGCRIRCNERFPLGIYTRVEAEFRLDGTPFRLAGVVQAIHDRREVGIRFLDVGERKRGQLEQLISDIEEEKRPGLPEGPQGPPEGLEKFPKE
jgi:hypothetical protein